MVNRKNLLMLGGTGVALLLTVLAIGFATEWKWMRGEPNRGDEGKTNVTVAAGSKKSEAGASSTEKKSGIIAKEEKEHAPKIIFPEAAEDIGKFAGTWYGPVVEIPRSDSRKKQKIPIGGSLEKDDLVFRARITLAFSAFPGQNRLNIGYYSNSSSGTIGSMPFTLHSKDSRAFTIHDIDKTGDLTLTYDWANEKLKIRSPRTIDIASINSPIDLSGEWARIFTPLPPSPAEILAMKVQIAKLPPEQRLMKSFELAKINAHFIHDHDAKDRPIIRISLENANLTDEQITMLALLPKLKTIRLVGYEKLTPNFLKALGSLPNKAEIAVGFSKNSPTDEDAFKALAACSNLRQLDLHAGITDAALKHLKHLPELRALSLPDTITDAGLIDVALLKNLRILGLPPSITEKGFANLSALENLELITLHRGQGEGLKHLARNQNMKQIAFGDITDDDMRHIGLFKKIEKVDLAKHDNLSAAGIKHLQNLENLQYLDLRSILIGDEGLSHLAGLVKLRVLFLSDSSDNEITDDGMKYVAKMKSLENLELVLVQLTDKGIRHLTTLPKLKHLTLQFCLHPISNKNIEQLKAFQQLETLRIGELGITPEFIENLQKALPKCKVNP